MIFAHPWMFLLLPLPILVRAILPPFHDTRPAVRVPIFDLLVSSVDTTASRGAVVRRRTRSQAILYAVVWISVVTALARPQWLQPPIVQEVATRDLMLAIDLSGSMETEDFVNSEGKTVDRLTAVKEVLDDFLTRRQGDRVGMIVFGTGAFVQIPFTQDLEVCRELLDQTAVRMAGPKTAFGDAIGLAITLFERSDLEDRVIIALTDGNDTGSKVPPAEAAKIAADNDILIHTIGVGDPTTAGEQQLDEDALREVAKVTGGQYFFAADRNELSDVYAELDRIGERPVETISHRPKQDMFHWPLAIGFLLALGHFWVRLLRRAIRSRRDVVTAEDATVEAAA